MGPIHIQEHGNKILPFKRGQPLCNSKISWPQSVRMYSYIAICNVPVDTTQVYVFSNLAYMDNNDVQNSQ